MFIQLTRIEDKKQIKCIIALADIKMIDNDIEQKDVYTKEHAKSSITTYSNTYGIPVTETQEEIYEALKSARMILQIKSSELD